jgi:hypothetical protein
LLSDIIGPVLVLQTTPLAVTLAPLSVRKFPPLLAVVTAIEETEVVVDKRGTPTEAVSKLTSAP